MRLHEFDMDAPELSPRARHQFRLRSRSLSALYERCFRGLVVDRAWKVLVECVEHAPREGVRDLLGVFTFQVKFDVRAAGSLSTLDQKRTLLDVLHDGVLRVAQASGWPTEPFFEARQCVLDRGFVNQWRWGTKWGPGRKLRAEVVCEHAPDVFRAHLEVLDRAGTVVRQRPAFETIPDEFVFAPNLGQLKWVSQDRVALLDRSGAEVASVTV